MMTMTVCILIDLHSRSRSSTQLRTTGWCCSGHMHVPSQPILYACAPSSDDAPEYDCWRMQADPQTSTSGVLHVGSNDNLIARQQSVADRQGQEQQQQGLHHAHAKQVTQPVVRLTLNASKSDSANSLSEGQIHVSTQSWLEQVTAKAKAKMQQQNKAC